MRPISSPVRGRLATHLQRQNKLSYADALTEATTLIKFIGAAGLDVVMPEWVPVDEDRPQPRKKAFQWENLAATLQEHEDREPWKPYNA